MPRAWTEQEKDAIWKALRESGQRLFEKYGIRKTTVDDIVRAAKISKGAFYSFYDSKEELYFEILTALEKKLHDDIYGSISSPGQSPQDSFRRFLRKVIDILIEEPIYSRMSSSDFDYLVSRLSDGELAAHVKADFEKMSEHFGEWMKRGWMRKVDIRALNGIMLSLFYFVVHRDDLKGTDFEAATDLWIDMAASYLVPARKETKHG